MKKRHVYSLPDIWALVIIFVLTWLTFGKSVGFGFISWDDTIHIYENSLVTNFSFSGFIGMLTPFYNHTIAPHFIWGILYKYGESNPMYFHFINVLLHSLNAVLVFIVTKKLFLNKNAALFCALIFAVHPVHTEAVAWSSALKDILYSLSYFLCIIVYVSLLEKNSRWKVLLTVFFFLLATSSKVQALTLPFILLFIEWFKYSKISLKNSVLSIGLLLLGLHFFKFSFIIFSVYAFLSYEKITYKEFFDFLQKIKKGFISLKYFYKISLIVIFFYGLWFISEDVYIYFFKSGTANYWNFEINLFSFSFTERILMSAYALTYYIKAFLYPINLVAMHPYPDFSQEGVKAFYAMHLFVYLILGAVFFYLFKTTRLSVPKRKIIIFGGLFFLINISLVLHIIPIHGRLVVADRYSYLAIWGLIIIVLLLFENIKAFNKALYYVLNIVIVGFLAFQSYTYTQVWSDSLTLYNDILAKNPEAVYAYNNRAEIHLSNGNQDLALKDYKKATEIKPDYHEAYYNMGLIYYDRGENEKALEVFNKAVKYSRNLDPEALTSRGWIKYLHNDAEGAIMDYNAALDIDSNYFLAYNNRALLLFDMGDVENAISDINKSLDIKPSNPMSLNTRGWFKLSSDDLDGAIEDFYEAYNLNNTFETVLLNLAWSYYLKTDFDKAAIYYSKAIDINPHNASALYYLGLSKLNMQNIDGACFYFEKSASLGWKEAIDMFNRKCAGN